MGSRFGLLKSDKNVWMCVSLKVGTNTPLMINDQVQNYFKLSATFSSNYPPPLNSFFNKPTGNLLSPPILILIIYYGIFNFILKIALKYFRFMHSMTFLRFKKKFYMQDVMNMLCMSLSKHQLPYPFIP